MRNQETAKSVQRNSTFTKTKLHYTTVLHHVLTASVLNNKTQGEWKWLKLKPEKQLHSSTFGLKRRMRWDDNVLPSIVKLYDWYRQVYGLHFCQVRLTGDKPEMKHHSTWMISNLKCGKPLCSELEKDFAYNISMIFLIT